MLWVPLSWLVWGGRREVKGRAETLEGNKWQRQFPLLLPLDLGSENADWGLPHLSIIQSTIHSWPIGFPCLSLLLGVKWSAGTLLILISLSIRPHSSVNESVCQSDRFRCCRFPARILWWRQEAAHWIINWMLDPTIHQPLHDSRLKNGRLIFSHYSLVL